MEVITLKFIKPYNMQANEVKSALTKEDFRKIRKIILDMNFDIWYNKAIKIERR